MKRFILIMMVLVGTIALASSCSVGYATTAEPKVIVYEDGRYNNIELLWLIEYGLYYNRPYYYYRHPIYTPPPPKPKHKPTVAPPTHRGNGGQPRGSQPRVSPNNSPRQYHSTPPGQQHAAPTPSRGSGGARGRR